MCQGVRCAGHKTARLQPGELSFKGERECAGGWLWKWKKRQDVRQSAYLVKKLSIGKHLKIMVMNLLRLFGMKTSI